MITYLFPILGGVAITGFAGTTIGRYVQESLEERLEWLDEGLSGIKDKESFRHGIAVKIESSNGTSNCDEDWKKKTWDDKTTQSCQKIKSSWEKIQNKLHDNSKNEEWNSIYEDVKDLDHDNKHCNIFNWSPVQIIGDVGLKEAIKISFELNCFDLKEESKAKEFKEFLEKVTSSYITTDQESKLIGGIIAGSLESSVAEWSDIGVNGNLQMEEINNIFNGISEIVKNDSRFKLQAKPDGDKGWSLLKFKKN